MMDQQGFLRALREKDDPTTYLVWADWLAENKQEALAGFVRLIGNGHCLYQPVESHDHLDRLTGYTWRRADYPWGLTSANDQITSHLPHAIFDRLTGFKTQGGSNSQWCTCQFKVDAYLDLMESWRQQIKPEDLDYELTRIAIKPPPPPPPPPPSIPLAPQPLSPQAQNWLTWMKSLFQSAANDISEGHL